MREIIFKSTRTHKISYANIFAGMLIFLREVFAVQKISFIFSAKKKYFRQTVCFWLVGCFGFNGPLRQYFSLYRAVSQREGERGE